MMPALQLDGHHLILQVRRIRDGLGAFFISVFNCEHVTHLYITIVAAQDKSILPQNQHY